MFQLVLFEEHDGSGERVAILTSGEDPEEYCPTGYYIDKILEIRGDATTFPTDRLLEAS
jgi:hypothetical protein